MRIDSHQHFWKYNPVRDAWINDDMRVIQRDFFPTDLESILNENQLDGCVSVQADQSEEENLFLLECADQKAFIKGVLGWIDLRSEQAEQRLAHFVQFKKFKGVRHVVQGEPDDAFMMRDDFCAGISNLKKFNLTYDILIYPKQLKAALELVQKFPDQPFVIDHIAKPFIKEGRLDNWSQYIRELGKCDNVYCKLSGMVTEADWKNWKSEDFNPYVDVVVESFGTKRLMYGSDWPVCLVAASYKKQLSVIENYIASFSESEKTDIMGLNAKRFYNL